MSWGYSDEIEAADERSRGCRCQGLGYVPIRGAGNPMACEPCGCDEPDEVDDEDLAPPADGPKGHTEVGPGCTPSLTPEISTQGADHD